VKHYAEMFLEGPIKATKIVRQNIRCYRWNSKRPPPKKIQNVTVWSPVSISWYVTNTLSEPARVLRCSVFSCLHEQQRGKNLLWSIRRNFTHVFGVNH